MESSNSFVRFWHQLAEIRSRLALLPGALQPYLEIQRYGFLYALERDAEYRVFVKLSPDGDVINYINSRHNVAPAMFDMEVVTALVNRGVRCLNDKLRQMYLLADVLVWFIGLCFVAVSVLPVYDKLLCTIKWIRFNTCHPFDEIMDFYPLIFLLLAWLWRRYKMTVILLFLKILLRKQYT